MKTKHVKYTKTIDLIQVPHSSRNSALHTPLKTPSITTFSTSTSIISTRKHQSCLSKNSG